MKSGMTEDQWLEAAHLERPVFLLVVNLGNDSAQTYEDLGHTLHKYADRMLEHNILQTPEDGDETPILDQFGNRIGHWQVIA